MPIKTLMGREDLIYIVAMGGLSLIATVAIIMGCYEEIRDGKSPPVLWSLATSCVWALIHTAQSWKTADVIDKCTDGSGRSGQSDSPPS